MDRLKLKPFSIPCQKCGKPIMIKSSEFKIGNIKKCPHCSGFTFEITDDLEKEIKKSIKKHFIK